MVKFRNRYSHQPIYTDSGKQKYQSDDLSRLIANNQAECGDLEVLMEAYKVFLAVPGAAKDKAKLQKLLSDKDSYRDEIVFSNEKELRSLSLNPRIAGKNLWKGASDEMQKKLLHSINSLDELEELLNRRLQKNGLEMKDFDFQVPIPADMRRIIRLEFDGSVEKQDEDILSAAYRSREPKNMENSDDNLQTIGAKIEERAKKFDLKDFPVWEKFARFESFRRIEDEVKKALAFANVSPEMAPTMRVADVEDALWRYKDFQRKAEYVKNRDERRLSGKDDGKPFRSSNRIELFEGARAFAVKTFAKNHGEEFSEMLREMKVDEVQISRALTQMGKGKLSRIELPDGKILVPTVHHDHAIQDAGYLKDITEVNRIKNFRIMYDVEQRQQRESSSMREAPVTEKETFLNDEIDVVKDTPSQIKIALNGDCDLNMLHNNEEARKEMVKKLALENIDALFTGMRRMGISTDAIQQVILGMHREGKIDNVEFEPGRYVGLDLRKTEYGTRLTVTKKSFPKEQMSSMHKSVMHGIDGAPLSIAYGQEPHAVLAGDENREGKTEYDVKGVKSILNQVKKKIARVSFKSAVAKPFAVIAGFKKSIGFNEKDFAEEKNRFNPAERSVDNQYQGSREK